ncbi:MAG: type II toxin-antitoxin system HipA family toxin [Verrucomicrobiales bacterium]|nr:type II toxin-antitoxin system HipA family toxin [Verrucomicrobiales bacterium]
MIEQLHAIADGKAVGILSWNRNSNQFRFVYDDEWIDSPNGYPLSLSMPMAGRQYSHKVVSAFIEGLLPDNSIVLDEWAKRFNVSAKNPFRLLAHVGEECAGAIQFVTPDRLREFSGESRGGIDWLDSGDLAHRIDLLMKNHGATRLGETEGQFSLAGAQPKIALFYDRKQDRWGIPSGLMPTTHILKPSGSDLNGHAENEHFCLKLAEKLGFPTAKSDVKTLGGRSVIVVERYDRIETAEGVRRIHQEDMCQSLACDPGLKYQREGGPSPEQIIKHILGNSSSPVKDQERFIDALIFNFLIGGTDAHAKNYSFLIAAGGQVRLAPLYDIASVFPYKHLYNERKTRLAMKIGGKYKFSEIGEAAWRKAASEWQINEKKLFSKIQEISGRIVNLSKSVHEEMKESGIDHEVVEGIPALIASHAEREAFRLA